MNALKDRNFSQPKNIDYSSNIFHQTINLEIIDNLESMKCLLIVSFLIISFISTAQTSSPDSSWLIPDSLLILDQEPAYPGGLEKFYSDLEGLMRYPISERLKGIEGKVLVQFDVNRVGQVENILILDGISRKCDKQVVKAIGKTSGRWSPGTVAGRKVKVRMTLPINFRLNH
ncbi:MAG: energy transducer TonB [Cyclobacteriaceae bacterium]